jgi:hypothetical protein
MMITSRRMKLAGNAAGMAAMRNTYKIVVEKPEWKRPLGKPRRRWQANVKIHLKEIR